MSSWDDLKATLIELQRARPQPLISSPNPDVNPDGDGHSPPFAITLAPWAVHVAQDLHERFGPDVSLVVGVLTFPDRRRRPAGAVADPTAAGPELDPGELAVELEAPLSVASGHTARSGLRITNRAAGPVVLLTNGALTAQVVDRASGAVVGGFAGWQTSPLVRFRVEPGQVATIPLLVGTASFEPKLGYTIPPGDWAVSAPINLEGRPTVRTPALPMTVL